MTKGWMLCCAANVLQSNGNDECITNADAVDTNAVTVTDCLKVKKVH